MGWQRHQLDHMQIICTSLQTNNQANSSSLNFYRPDVLFDAQPTVSKHWRQCSSTKSQTKMSAPVWNKIYEVIHTTYHNASGKQLSFSIRIKPKIVWQSGFTLEIKCPIFSLTRVNSLTSPRLTFHNFSWFSRWMDPSFPELLQVTPVLQNAFLAICGAVTAQAQWT